MIGASKILTVSYGTFSCTLEGFDEPFNTMKAIAEYFRDLASEDRYFGAEPPTPDAAMLHRIAEREIQRRVEAKVQDNGVILRAGETAALGPAVAAAPAVVAPTVAEAAPAVGETVAMRLSRLRATEAPVATAPAVDDFIEDEHADQILSRLAALPPSAAPAATPLPEIPAERALDAMIAAATDLPEDAADLPADEVLPEDLPDDAAMAEATDRLPPLGTAADDDDEDDDDFVDATRLPPVDEPRPLSPRKARKLAARAEAAAAAQRASLDDDPAFEAEIAAAIAEPLDLAKAEDWVETEDLAPEPPASADLSPEPAAEAAPRARARVIRIRRADPAPEVEAPHAAPAAETDAAHSLLSPEAEAALQAELAALEAELPESSAAEPAPARPVRPVRSLRPAPPAPATPTAAEPRKRLEAEAQEDDLSRLIAQTNSEMDGEDTKRRQAAIAHLKAAVAATEADRQVQGMGAQAPADRRDAYRSDLESVVRPRAIDGVAQGARPSPLVLVSAQRIDRPKTPPPAAANDAPRIVSPVRPRRVPTMNVVGGQAQSQLGLATDQAFDLDDLEATPAILPEPRAGDESFTAFAARLGARDLAALVEAAAVYCAKVLGCPQFSRPLILRQIESLPTAAAYGLEDVLRAFGVLLRQGRVAKIKRGQFAVTDRSPLLAEALRSES